MSSLLPKNDTRVKMSKVYRSLKLYLLYSSKCTLLLSALIFTLPEMKHNDKKKMYILRRLNHNLHIKRMLKFTFQIAHRTGC